jgi:hypothetical protein
MHLFIRQLGALCIRSELRAAKTLTAEPARE